MKGQIENSINLNKKKIELKENSFTEKKNRERERFFQIDHNEKSDIFDFV